MTSKNNVNTKLPMNPVGKTPVLLGKKVLYDMNKGVLKPYVQPDPPSILIRNEPRRIAPKNLIIDRRQLLNTGQNIQNYIINENRSRRVPGNSSITQQKTINQQTPDSLSNVVVIDLLNNGDMMNFNHNVHSTEESNIPQVVGFENANKELYVIKNANILKSRCDQYLTTSDTNKSQFVENCHMPNIIRSGPNRSILKKRDISTVGAEDNTVQGQTEKVIKRHFNLKSPCIIKRNTILPHTSYSNIIDSNSRKHKISHDSHFENKRRLINSELNEGVPIIMGNQVKETLMNQPNRCETFTSSSISVPDMLNTNKNEYYNPQVNVTSPVVPKNLRNNIGYIAVKAFKQSVQIDINGNIPLQTAIIEEDKSSFLQQYVAIKHSNPKIFDHQNHSLETALFLAVKYAYEEGVALLLRCGADQTIQDNCGNTPLHVAARDELLNCCKLLLKADGADLVKNKFNDEGLTPLHIATIYGHYNIVRLLTYENVDINMKDSKCGRTAYNLALYHGKDSIANLLMNLNCITTDHDYSGHLPIHEKVTQPKSNDSNIDLLIGCVINTKSTPNKDKFCIQGKKQMVK
uniref:Uncharacterized protein n=1 Tax=Clastoptera arizonana TaxID=38151 RepID=A0A1B6DNZ6_9HEMI